jgi:hypothetical protein
MTTADDYYVRWRTMTVSEYLENSPGVVLYLRSMGKSATEARLRRKTCADLTRGAWPQSMRALAENAIAMVSTTLEDQHRSGGCVPI